MPLSVVIMIKNDYLQLISVLLWHLYDISSAPLTTLTSLSVVIMIKNDYLQLISGNFDLLVHLYDISSVPLTTLMPLSVVIMIKNDYFQLISAFPGVDFLRFVQPVSSHQLKLSLNPLPPPGPLAKWTQSDGCKIDSRGLFYKTFCGHNLQIFVMS
jgi:hypothetical protein